MKPSHWRHKRTAQIVWVFGYAKDSATGHIYGVAYAPTDYKVPSLGIWVLAEKDFLDRYEAYADAGLHASPEGVVAGAGEATPH